MPARRGKSGAQVRAHAAGDGRSPLHRLRKSSRQEQEWRLGWEADSWPSAADPAPLAGDPIGTSPVRHTGPAPGGDVTSEIRIDLTPAVEPEPGPVSAPVIRFVAPPGPPPVRSSFARAWSVPQPQPADAREMVLRFRRAAVSLAMSLDEGTARGEHGRECAAALIALASSGQEHLLAPVLRADPDREDVTWTVACYQIGDLSPTTLRDFGDASSAVRNLAGCGEAAHVAAELIVTNGDGVRWTALVRSGTDVTFQLLEAGTASAGTAAVLQGVRHRWEDLLLDWAARPTAGLAEVATPADGPAAPPVPPPVPAGPGDGVAMGMALGQLLESVRRIEERLAPAASPAPALDTAGRVERLEREVAELRRELAAAIRRVADLEAAGRVTASRLVDSRAAGTVLAAGVTSAPAEPPGPAVWLR